MVETFEGGSLHVIRKDVVSLYLRFKTPEGHSSFESNVHEVANPSFAIDVGFYRRAAGHARLKDCLTISFAQYLIEAENMPLYPPVIGNC